MAITNVDFLSPKNFDQNLRKEKASILLLACNSYYMCSRKIVICIKHVKQYAFLRQAKANQISKKRNNDKMTVNTITATFSQRPTLHENSVSLTNNLNSTLV
jgi:hypothetical protein